MSTAPRPSLTATGVAVVTGALALVVLGWALGYTVLTVLAVGAALALVAAWFAASGVPRLTIERAVEPGRVPRGQSARAVMSVRNPARRRSRPCVAVDHIGAERIELAIPALAPGRTIATTAAVPTNRRGIQEIGPLAIARQDVFGLWRTQRHVGTTAAVLVEPRIHPLDPRPAGRTRHVEGPVSDTAPRGTQTFHSLRAYTAGDDVRRIHWRSSARTGTLLVREHIDTSLPSTVVVLDTRADRYDGDGFEEAVDVASSVLAAAQARGFPVRLVTTGGTAVGARAGQRGQTLRDALTRVGTDDGDTMLPATTAVLRGRDHDVIVVVTGRVDVSDLGQVTTMTRRFASPTVVTIEATASTPSPRWPSGRHLRGATAVEALRWWGSA